MPKKSRLTEKTEGRGSALFAGDSRLVGLDPKLILGRTPPNRPADRVKAQVA